MFAGEYRCRLDEKGRFPIPQPLREELHNEGPEKAKAIVLLKGQERCLWLFGVYAWRRILDRIREQLDEDQSRLFMHFVVSEAVEGEIDRVGRILVPKKLREYAALENEVVVLGLYDRIEVWSLQEWEAYLTRVEEKYETALSKFLNIL
jgi:MraZ protein